MFRTAKFDEKDARCSTPSATPSSTDSDSDDKPIAFQSQAQHRKSFQSPRKSSPKFFRLPKKRKRVILKGGEDLQELLHHMSATSNSAASANLRNLHLALGAQWLRFLPKYRDFEYDRTNMTDEHLPVIVLVGTYIPASTEPTQQFTKKGRKGVTRTKKFKQKFTDKLEIWAHHALPVEPTLYDPTPITPIEWLVYDEERRNIADVPGLKEEDPWDVKSTHINFLPPFEDAKSEGEVRCLIRYTLLLSSTHGLYGIDYTQISRGIGFTNMLLRQCKRRWEEERFKTLDETGILPPESDVWKGAVAIETERVEPVGQFSASECSGEDEIPAMEGGLPRQHPVWKEIKEEEVGEKGKVPEKLETVEKVVKVSQTRGKRFEQFSATDSEGEDEIPAAKPDSDDESAGVVEEKPSV